MNEKRTLHRHPYSGETYMADDENRVEVTRDGISGLFTRDGEWITGKLKSADPIYCRWATSGIIIGPKIRKMLGEKDA